MVHIGRLSSAVIIYDMCFKALESVVALIFCFSLSLPLFHAVKVPISAALTSDHLVGSLQKL